jgi:hypothetical protein
MFDTRVLDWVANMVFIAIQTSAAVSMPMTETEMSGIREFKINDSTCWSFATHHTQGFLLDFFAFLLDDDGLGWRLRFGIEEAQQSGSTDWWDDLGLP